MIVATCTLQGMGQKSFADTIGDVIEKAARTLSPLPYRSIPKVPSGKSPSQLASRGWSDRVRLPQSARVQIGRTLCLGRKSESRNRDNAALPRIVIISEARGIHITDNIQAMLDHPFAKVIRRPLNRSTTLAKASSSAAVSVTNSAISSGVGGRSVKSRT